MTAKKETWETIARRLRKRGWRYHDIEWLFHGEWSLEIRECDDSAQTTRQISVRGTTLLACYRAAEAETKRRRVIG